MTEDIMNKKAGILYGIGVGPGDPDLITIKAAKILNQVDIVFAAASTKNNHSLAVNIASEHIPESATVKMLRFPMTRDKDETRRAWKEHALTIIAELEKGRNVAFLTLGDSMTYSTFGYVLRYVQELAPHIPVISVPGITSYQAAAACLNTPLVEGEEALLVLSGVSGGGYLRKIAVKPDNLVFMKAYRNMEDIAAALDEFDLLDNSVAIKNCGLPEQEIVENIRELTDNSPNYWTLVLSKKKK